MQVERTIHLTKPGVRPFFPKLKRDSLIKIETKTEIIKFSLLKNEVMTWINISLTHPRFYIFFKLLYVKLPLKILNEYKYILTHNKYFVIFLTGMDREKNEKFF